MKVIRNLDTPESRAFWNAVKQAAAVLKTWPDWRKAGHNEGKP